VPDACYGTAERENKGAGKIQRILKRGHDEVFLDQPAG
jgi:hypothetical protein